MRILVFAGTTEAREFVKKACECGFEVTASVATEYGREVLEESMSLYAERVPHCKVLAGRMGVEEMRQAVAGFDAVVDATHPYALIVSENVQDACTAADKPYLRFCRDCSDGLSRSEEDAVIEFPSLAGLCAALEKESGNIFITTGSRDVAAFSAVPRIAERGWIRVLPSAEAIEKCRSAGFLQSHIIAMQRPFSRQLNEAMFKEVNASVLVTKRSGKNGGYSEKVLAATACKMKTFALLCPQAAFSGAYTNYDDLIAALNRIRGGL